MTMTERTWRVVEKGVAVAGVGVLAAMLVFGVFSLAGCAAGRGPAGEVVVGFDVASLPETTNQALGALTDLILPGGGAAVATIAGIVGVAVRNGAKRRQAEREAAELRGANSGWDDREKAAAVQAPLPVVPGGGAARVVDPVSA